MSRGSLFGSYYPPGCSGPPEPEVGPCPICGGPDDDCPCPACEAVVETTEDGTELKCGEYACLTHLPSGQLADLIYNLNTRLVLLNAEAAKREKPLPPCPKCGKVMTATIFDEWSRLLLRVGILEGWLV